MVCMDVQSTCNFILIVHALTSKKGQLRSDEKLLITSFDSLLETVFNFKSLLKKIIKVSVDHQLKVHSLKPTTEVLLCVKLGSFFTGGWIKRKFKVTAYFQLEIYRSQL